MWCIGGQTGRILILVSVYFQNNDANLCDCAKIKILSKDTLCYMSSSSLVQSHQGLPS